MPARVKRFKTRNTWMFLQDKRRAGAHERCKIPDKDLPYWSPTIEYRCVSIKFSRLGHTMPYMGRFQQRSEHNFFYHTLICKYAPQINVCSPSKAISPFSSLPSQRMNMQGNYDMQYSITYFIFCLIISFYV